MSAAFAYGRKLPAVRSGVAVRSDYDLTTLRGKGFIYIAIDMIVNRDFVQSTVNQPGMTDTLILHHLNVFNYDPNMVITECDHNNVKSIKTLLNLDKNAICVQLKFSHDDPGYN